MFPKIRKVAVLGAGVMGSGIAAHLANAGISCLMLDIVPPTLSDDEKKKGLTEKSPAFRNRFALKGLEGIRKSRPSLIYSQKDLARIAIGNFDDDFAKIAECDWIVEVVIENLAIKRALYAKIEALWKPGVVVSSNTSGISIAQMMEGRGKEFRRHFLVTHFFNPVRYMKLLEMVAGKDTDPAIFAGMADFGERVLGKGIVYGKDTPNFVGNRVGVFAMMHAMHAMIEDGLTIEEVDKILGPAMGRPKSAAFGTADLVGLDTLLHVSDNVYANLEGRSRPGAVPSAPLREGDGEARPAGPQDRRRLLQDGGEGGHEAEVRPRLQRAGVPPGGEGLLPVPRRGEGRGGHGGADRESDLRGRQGGEVRLEGALRHAALLREADPGDRRRRGQRRQRDEVGIQLEPRPLRDVGRDRVVRLGGQDEGRGEGDPGERREDARLGGVLLLSPPGRCARVFRFRLRRVSPGSRLARYRLPPVPCGAEEGDPAERGGVALRHRRRRAVRGVPHEDERHRRRHRRHADGGRRSRREGVRGARHRQPRGALLRRGEPDARLPRGAEQAVRQHRNDGQGVPGRVHAAAVLSSGRSLRPPRGWRWAAAPRCALAPTGSARRPRRTWDWSRWAWGCCPPAGD